MLSSIRKFSSSIYSKIFLFIVAIPFVFWGMGPLFTGGNLNTIVQIEKEKVSTQEFADFVQNRSKDQKILDKNLIDKLLSSFIGEKIINEEIKKFDIRISNNSLSKLIKNQKIFKKNNEFSRTEYEKFLIKNRLSAVVLEANILQQEKKKQLFDFIGGGILPAKFLVNIIYDKINQKRSVQVINLNDVLKKKSNFTESQIESYFNQNKDSFKNIYKSIRFVNLNPKNLTGDDEISNLFFEKIDEVDDLIVEGNNLDMISNKFNLNPVNSATFSELDMDQDLQKINDFSAKLIKDIFNINDTEPTALIFEKDKFFVVEVTKTENILKKVNDQSVKKEILENLEKEVKRKLISKIIDEINKNNFKKNDFDELSKDENVIIKKISLENQHDDKILKKELINQIYSYPEKKVIVVADKGLKENFLVYIDKIENATIDKKYEDYEKYFNISKIKLANNLYNTYDSYLQNKYEININNKALDSIKNNLR